MNRLSFGEARASEDLSCRRTGGSWSFDWLRTSGKNFATALAVRLGSANEQMLELLTEERFTTTPPQSFGQRFDTRSGSPSRKEKASGSSIPGSEVDEECAG